MARPGAFDVSIDVEPRSDAVILSVVGELDSATAPMLRESIVLALENRPKTLVVDLTRVTFLASAGMCELLEAEDLSSGRTAVRVVAAHRETLRPIQLTSLDTVLTIHPTVDDALEPL